MGPEATALREKVAALTAAGVRNVVLNMAKVDYIDSTGLGALVMCATSLRKSGGNVKLRQPQPPQHRTAGDDQAGHGFRDLSPTSRTR